MIRIELISLSLFLSCFIFNGYSQSDKNWMDIALKKGKSIQCGKIDFIIKEKSKGSKDFTETHASLIFSNEKKKRLRECSYINLFFKEDSVQYIGTPAMLVTIDYKQKVVLIDSSKNRQAHAKSLLSEFMEFYTNDLASVWFMGKPVQKRLTETDSSILFTLESNKIRPTLSEKYRKKMEKEEEKHEDDPFYIFKIMQTPYLDVYESRKSDTLLLKHSSKVLKTKPYAKRAVIESSSYLIAADINNPKYQSLDFYNYLSYSENDYKTKGSLSRETLKQMLDSTKNTTAPDFILPVIGKNDTITLSDYKGQWVLLDFWFMACVPCRKLAPQIESIYKQYETKGLKVFGINIDENNENLRTFVSKTKHSYPMLCSYGTDITSFYKVSSYPTVIVINPEQTIVFTGTGSDVAGQLQDFLNENLK